MTKKKCLCMKVSFDAVLTPGLKLSRNLEISKNIIKHHPGNLARVL